MRRAGQPCSADQAIRSGDDGTRTHAASPDCIRKAIVLTVGVDRHSRQLSQACRGDELASASGPRNLLRTRSFAHMPVCSGQCAGDGDPISLYFMS
jgi:hypothetical protein